MSTDCLNEIFEILKDDIITLHSCLLVNRLWCKISVRILWKNVIKSGWILKTDIQRRSSAILSTLVSCLSNESKELLRKNGIVISTPTSNPPLFNYASFCKVLSVREIYQIINYAIPTSQNKSWSDENHEGHLVVEEIFKMFMSQISSLKGLTYRYGAKIH